MAVKEISFEVSIETVREKSQLAVEFLDNRDELNIEFMSSNNKFVKRFINLGTNAYLPSEGIPVKYKELMGLSVSAGMRCESCIFYHLIQAYRLGASRLEIEETLNISLLIGGSITIPSLRKAAKLTNQLYQADQ